MKHLNFSTPCHNLLAQIAKIFLLLAIFATTTFAQTAAKPLDLAAYDRLLCVKFQNDLPVFEENGRLTDNGTGLLAPLGIALKAGIYHKLVDMDASVLDEMRYKAQIFWDNAARADATLRPGKMADMNRYFTLLLYDGVDKEQVMRLLQSSPLIEHVSVMPKPVTLPTPNYVGNQTYLSNDYGINANQVYSTYNNRGNGIKVVDIEGAFNSAHKDLPSIPVVSGTYFNIPNPNNPNDYNHGTAVLGEMVSIDNGWGTTGIASAGNAMFAGILNQYGYYNFPNAITRAVSASQAGDVILIEQHLEGPYSHPGGGQIGYVPVEYYKVNYDAVKIAVGNNRIVVEAAGNGYQNLDSGLNYQGDANHLPFSAPKISGAIMVGAGYAATTGSVNARSRMDYSNFGSRVDVQAFGEKVWTTGIGDAYGTEGVNYWYTSSFNGTSSASPIVAGACMLIQSMYKIKKNGAILSPLDMRSLLVSTGKAQQAGPKPISEKIGPLPNAYAAIQTFANTATCTAPTVAQMSVTSITSNSARLNCSVTGVQSYGWAYRQVGASSWVNLSATTSNYTNISGLTANKQYEFVTIVSCSTNTWSNWSSSKAFTTASSAPTAPSNDVLCNATLITAGSSCSYTSGTTSGATATFIDVMCGTTNPKDVWFRCAIPSSGKVTFRTNAGSLSDAVMGVFWGSSCSSLNYIACEDDNSNGNGSNMPVMSITGQAGTMLWIRVWGYDNASGSFSICALNYSTANFGSGGTEAGIVYNIDPSSSNQTAYQQYTNEDAPSDRSLTTLPTEGFVGALYPNPATDIASLPYTLPEAGTVQIALCDLLGRQVQTQTFEQSSGEHQAAIDLTSLNTGLYYVRFQAGDLVKVQAVQVLR